LFVFLVLGFERARAASKQEAKNKKDKPVPDTQVSGTDLAFLFFVSKVIPDVISGPHF